MLRYLNDSCHPWAELDQNSRTIASKEKKYALKVEFLSFTLYFVNSDSHHGYWLVKDEISPSLVMMRMEIAGKLGR